MAEEFSIAHSLWVTRLSTSVNFPLMASKRKHNYLLPYFGIIASVKFPVTTILPVSGVEYLDHELPSAQELGARLWSFLYPKSLVLLLMNPLDVLP